MIKKCLSLHRCATKKTKALIDFWVPLQLNSNSERNSCNKPWITKGLLKSINVKNKLYKKWLKLRTLSKILEPGDKVKAYKANLTKLIRINKTKHHNNCYLENKKNLLKHEMEYENLSI